MSIDKLKSKFFTGAFISDVKHYFNKINEIIDYLNNNPIITPPTYHPPSKLYFALLTSNGNNITSTVGYSEITNPIFSKDSQGYYKADLSTILSSLGVNYKKCFITITDNVLDITKTIKVNLRTDDILEIYTWNNTILTDNILLNTPIKIEIYS